MSGKQLSILTVSVALLVLVLIYGRPVEESVPAGPQLSVDPLNLTYDIEKNFVPLQNGVADQEIDLGCKNGLCPKAIYETRVFGQPVWGDLNGDGAADAAMTLTQKTGGSGTFYYVVAALATAEGGTAAGGTVFLGDRIAPQNISIENGVIIMNYADRGPEESFITPPSIGKTVRMRVLDGELERL